MRENLASILFESLYFFCRNSILPTLFSHTIFVLSMEVVKSTKSFASHFSQKQTQRAREPLGGTVP